MAVKDLKTKLENLTSGNKSNWKEKAKGRIENRNWLQHSRKIAIKINVFLKNNNIKQKDLAELLDVSPQQVSKILKGKENLKLETISKIENALNIELINSDEPSENKAEYV